MRAFLLSFLLMTFTGIFLTANAQVTAVMQAKVNIVSGAGLNSIQEAVIDLSSANLYEYEEDYKTGSFSLIAAPGTDINVHVSQESEIKNAKGEIIEFDSFSVDQNTAESGKHHITVNGKLKNQQQLLSGQYKGSVTAVVEYL